MRSRSDTEIPLQLLQLACHSVHYQSLCNVGTAHYLFGLRGCKYSIRDNDFVVKASIRDTIFFQNI